MHHSDATDVAATQQHSATDGRPDFLVRLGLLMPCSVEDVEAAYRDRAKRAHPDAGGSVDEFIQLQRDYENAREYARFHASRRGWLATVIERYAEQEEVVAEIRRRGGIVETKSNEWIAREIGADFAQVLDKVEGVRLGGSRIKRPDVEWLAEQSRVLGGLHRLDLSGARIGNAAVPALTRFPTLHELNLSGTFVSDRSLRALAGIKTLRRVHLARTLVSVVGLLRLRQMRPDLEIITRYPAGHPLAKYNRRYRWARQLVLVYLMGMLVATHMPLPELPVEPPTWRLVPFDKLAHFSIYAGFALLVAFLLALRNPERSTHIGLRVRGYIGLWLGIALWAAIDEMTQPWTGRSLDLRDWMADVLGATVGLAVFTAIRVWQLRQRRAAALAPRPM